MNTIMVKPFIGKGISIGDGICTCNVTINDGIKPKSI